MSFGGITSVAMAITTIALMLVLVSSSNTAKIISATTSGFANSIKAALGK